MAIPGYGGPAQGKPSTTPAPAPKATGGTAAPLRASSGGKQLTRAQMVRRSARQQAGISNINSIRDDPKLLAQARSLGLLAGGPKLKPGIPNAAQATKVAALRAAVARRAQSNANALNAGAARTGH